VSLSPVVSVVHCIEMKNVIMFSCLQLSDGR
jgi:hypothetical protein